MYRIFKRIFDITFAGLGVIVISPVMGLVALLLRLGSPGPVIFSHERIGLHGKSFRMHKFRKFPPDWGNHGPGVTVAFDARMSRFGAFLERTKLDELPQLWNVLKGEMSFVGPRPESLQFDDLFTGKYAAVLEYIPGIFGPSQISFRNESDLYPADEDPHSYYRSHLFPQKAELDLTYFQNATLISDFLWILKGTWASITGIIKWKHFMGVHAKILLMDLLMIQSAWIIAHLLRFLTWPQGEAFIYFYTGLWLIPPLLIGGLFLGGCYRSPLYLFSLGDAVRLVITLSITWIPCFIILIYIDRSIGFSLIPMVWFVLLPLLAFPRILSSIRSDRTEKGLFRPSNRIVVYGAGKRGLGLLNWVNNGNADFVGFLDDSPQLRGRYVHGYRVLGRESDIPTVHCVHHIDEIWVTFNLNSQKLNRLLSLCDEHQIRLVVLPELEPFYRLFRHASALADQQS
jgi:lipopolysaccharide/colanic/teichoic acid biosynthesis glycosyltransferase